jgi:hypothetical protein
MEEIRTTPGNTQEKTAKRSFLLTVLCLFSFVFFGLITVLFLFALLYSGSITDMVLRYAPENSPSRVTVLFYILGGFLLHGLSLAGIIMIWRMRRLGYILFGASAMMIAAYQLYATQISPLTTAFYIALIFSFGFYLKKLK